MPTVTSWIYSFGLSAPTVRRSSSIRISGSTILHTNQVFRFHGGSLSDEQRKRTTNNGFMELRVIYAADWTRI